MVHTYIWHRQCSYIWHLLGKFITAIKFTQAFLLDTWTYFNKKTQVLTLEKSNTHIQYTHSKETLHYILSDLLFPQLPWLLWLILNHCCLLACFLLECRRRSGRLLYKTWVLLQKKEEEKKTGHVSKNINALNKIGILDFSTTVLCRHPTISSQLQYYVDSCEISKIYVFILPSLPDKEHVSTF